MKEATKDVHIQQPDYAVMYVSLCFQEIYQFLDITFKMMILIFSYFTDNMQSQNKNFRLTFGCWLGIPTVVLGVFNSKAWVHVCFHYVNGSDCHMNSCE